MKKLTIKNGDKYGRLTVVSEVDPVGRYRRFLTKCDCGVVKTIRLNDIRSKKTTSCGCFMRQRVRETNTIHNMAHTPEYRAWWDMISRCVNKDHPSYLCYGGRGIDVDPQWKISFIAFIDSVGMRPLNEYELDRVDNNYGYFPGNVRWVSRTTNQRNKRTSLVWSVRGKEYKTLEEAATAENVSCSSIKYWCKGGKDYKTGKIYLPKPECFARRVYEK